MTFEEFLSGFIPIIEMFTSWIIVFANFLIKNYYILLFIGFIALFWIIDIVFDVMYNFKHNFANSVDDYLEKKADLDLAVRKAAEKELVMRQNRNTVFDPFTNKIEKVSLDQQRVNFSKRNYKNYAYFTNVKPSSHDEPWWIDLELEKAEISESEKAELDKMLKEFNNE